MNGQFFDIEKSKLLYFENSALAAMFSGRWDETNKNKGGRVVVYRDPDIFKFVIEFLQNGHNYPKIQDKKIAELAKEEF